MKNFDFDKVWVGCIAGFLSPVVAFTLYYFINYNFMTIGRFMDYMILGDTYTAVVTLCLLANLASFYLFIWRNKYMGARGVLGFTFVWAVLVMYLKFFTHE